ncbi:SpaA isopeptide-forming pilin-related protein [Paenibacillus sp. FA6]|uniref:SpaA isopeptide-forming pilin-related protein n=1 Tax=Paenibacillus sp. FA6 TaxID=3413029 RepID=UPI003F65576B
MKKHSKLLYLFMVVALVLNLVLPASMAIASNELEGSENGIRSTVTEDTYGDSAKMSLLAVGAPITDKIITGVKMYDKKPTYVGGILTPQGNEINAPNIRPSIKDEVAVLFDWSLPNESHSYDDGSTYTFQLPAQLKIGTELKGDLDGDVGTYVVSETGEVVFTFNDSIVGAQLEGNFYVWIKYDQSKFGDGLEQPIEFDFVGTAGATIDVHFANNATDGLTKTGLANNKNFNSDEIVWTVDFNQGEKLIKGALLDDNLPTDLTLKGNITVSPLIIQLDGTVKEGTPVYNRSAFPMDFIGIESADGVDGDITKAYRVTYTTSVKAPTTAPFKGKVFANEVTLTGNSGAINETVIGKATVSFNEPLSKSGQDSAYDSKTQTITWKVQYNYNQQTIPQSAAWIEDTFDSTNVTKQKVLDGKVTVYEVLINSSGTGTPNTVPVNPSEYEVTGIGTDFDGGFKLHFKNPITKAYEIVYQTQAQARIYKDETVSNTVKMGDGTFKTGKKDIKEIIFAKSVVGSNFNAKTINWELVLNQDMKDMTDVVITDNYAGRHMKLDPTSVKINGDPIVDTDFELAVNAGDAQYEQGFIIKLKSQLPPLEINSKYVITYTTSFDPTAGMPTDNKYVNTATLGWKEPGVTPDPTEITKSDSVTAESYTIENGNKRGDYNAKDKTITWMIDVNYNLFDIKDAIIKDNYTGDQTFVENSLKVSKLTLDPVSNKVTDVGGEVILTGGEFILNDDGKGFVLNLGDIGETAYRVEYKTSLDGSFPVQGTYSNNATLHDGDGGTQRFSKSIGVTPKNGGEYIRKTGKQKTSGSDIASWTININPSQSYVAAGSELTDTLSDNQILLGDTIKLYKTSIPTDNTGNVSTKNGLVDEEDYKLVVTGNTFTLKLLNSLNAAYILEYESYINADSGERIENNAQFQGQSSSVKGSDNMNGVKISLAGAGGGASAGKKSIQIVKVDDLDQPIPGVKFELYNASGSTLLESLITDGQGEAKTSREYKYNDKNEGLPYKLKEVSVPSGYLMDPEYAVDPTGKEIKFKDPTEPFKIVNKVIRQGFELTKVDAADFSEKLKGAVFELKLNGVLIDTLTTSVDGKIARGDLDPGDYELIEITAPDYYVVDATPIPVKIVANQTEVLVLSDQPNAQGTGGKLIITKVNAKDQSIIPGVEFELRDSEKNVVATKITDVNGVIEFTNLPYATYTLVETKAEGYVIEKAETDVAINQPETTKTIENKENDRSVKLTKYNLIKSHKLPGAIFELRVETKIFDQNGDFVFEAVTGIDVSKLTTDINGELLLEDLEPNKYQLVEVKAPFGYVLDKEPVDFEITTTQTESVQVEKVNNRIPATVNPGGPNGGGGGGGTPIEPTEPTLDVPVEPNKPEKPEPVVPVDPTEPKKPVTPDEKVVTPKETPVKGKIEVPKDNTPKIGEQPKNGKVTIDPKGNWVYTPDKGYVGKDSFTIIVTDKDGNEEEVLVEVDVNDIPRGGTDGVTKNTGAQTGEKLPQTGESSHLALQLTGSSFIILGATLFFRKRRLPNK